MCIRTRIRIRIHIHIHISRSLRKPLWMSDIPVYITY